MNFLFQYSKCLQKYSRLRKMLTWPFFLQCLEGKAKLYWHQLCSGLVLNLQKLLRVDLSIVIAPINNYCRNMKLEASNNYIRKEYHINTQIKLCPLGISQINQFSPSKMLLIFNLKLKIFCCIMRVTLFPYKNKSILLFCQF